MCSTRVALANDPGDVLSVAGPMVISISNDSITCSIFERAIEYNSNARATNIRLEDSMTTIQTAPSSIPTRAQPVRIPAKSNDRPMPRGSRRLRPGAVPPRHRRNGIRKSRAPHRRQPITPAATVALALLAALITMWLGVVAHFGEVISGPQVTARVPDRLAVVRVDAGETLQHLAGRVAPGAPVSQVSQRIRELNGMDSSAMSAGQTLIAPVG